MTTWEPCLQYSKWVFRYELKQEKASKLDSLVDVKSNGSRNLEQRGIDNQQGHLYQ